MDHATPDSALRPTRRDLFLILVVALALRGVVMIVMGLKAHDLPHLPYRSDGGAYVANAQRINGEGMPTAYDQRVFVGYPWLIAMTHRVGLPYGWGAMALGIGCAGLLCAATAAVFGDRRVGWAMAVLPPHWVLDTSAVLNESLMLLLCVAAFAAVMRRERGWLVAAAALFAAAGMVRPMACFATLGAIAMLVDARLYRRAGALAFGTGAALLILLVAFAALYWNPLDNARQYNAQPLAYNGRLITFPFGAFVDYARTRGLAHVNLIYKAGYLFAAVVVLATGVRVWRTTRRPLDAGMAVWWGTNLLFVLCIGSHWGVDIAQRAIMWAAPAAYWITRDWLPTRWQTRLAWALLPVPWVFITSQS